MENSLEYESEMLHSFMPDPPPSKPDPPDDDD